MKLSWLKAVLPVIVSLIFVACSHTPSIHGKPAFRSNPDSPLRGPILDRHGAILALTGAADNGYARHYRDGNLAVHLLGALDEDSKSTDGIEHQYDRILSDGDTVQLTIDLGIQRIVEKELEKAFRKTKAKYALVLAMNPATGEVLALAERPGYDPSSPDKFTRATRLSKVGAVYEVGGLMMPFLVAACLAEGIPAEGWIDAENGNWVVEGHAIKDLHPRGKMTLDEAMKYSSNIAAGKLALELGAERFDRWLRQFGFGSRTGFDGVMEMSTGIIPPADGSKPIYIAVRGFGQGMAVTPIQVLTGFNALVNGGNLMRPYVVAQTGVGNSAEVTTPTLVRRVISPEQSRQVVEMLEGVLQTDATGRQAQVEGYRVAGKTGTAQKIDPEKMAYDSTRRVLTFVGALPADNPRMSILVLIDEPASNMKHQYGGTVAAPVFSKIAEKVIENIPGFANIKSWLNGR